MSSVLRAGASWGAGLAIWVGGASYLKGTCLERVAAMPAAFAIDAFFRKVIPTRVTNFTLRERCVNALKNVARWSAFTAVAFSVCGAAAGVIDNPIPYTDQLVLRCVITGGLGALGGVQVSLRVITLLAPLGAAVGFIGDRSPAPAAQRMMET